MRTWTFIIIFLNNLKIFNTLHKSWLIKINLLFFSKNLKVVINLTQSYL